MKRIFNYIITSMVLFVTIILVTSGGMLQTLLGLGIYGIIWHSMSVMPTWWRMFYRTNLRILNYFGLL